MYKHIVFDLDGTTLDTDCAWLGALQQLLKEEFAIESQIAELIRFRGMSYRKIYAAFGATTDNECLRLANVHVKLVSSRSHQNRLFEGIAQLFDELDERGIQMGIVTSRIICELEDDPLWQSIAHRFPVVINGSMVEHLKPHAEPMELYLSRANAKKDEVLFIGDSPFDSGCAQSAGVDFALALWGTHDKDLPATYKLQHPLELLSYL